MWYGSSDDKTDRERQLEWELESARERERHREEEAREARRTREEERRERYEHRRRHAETWPEALDKQEALFRQEAALADGYDDGFFAASADACKRALEIWREEEKGVEETIRSLEAEIAALRNNVRFAVADRLEEEGDRSGWGTVAGDLRNIEEEPGALSNWLYW